jgi:hypothetical protein
MGDLKPLGSEKLQGDDKLKRILELAYYKENKNKSNTANKPELVKEGVNGVYGIVKEKDGYYVKKGLNESALEYIGGIFMKNKNKFTSYAEALKRLELIKSQELQEATKYVLKTNTPKSEEPMPSPAMDDAPAAPAPAPEAPAPAPEDGSAPESDPLSMSGEESPEPSDEPEMGGEEGGEEGGESAPEHMKEVQRLSGKLGQAIRDVNDKMESDDVKYVINMLLSAVDIEKLSEEDKEEIVDRFEPKEDGGEEIGAGDEEPSYDEAPELEGGDEDMSKPSSEEEVSEIEDPIASLEELVNMNFTEDDDVMPMDGEKDELDITPELSEINESIKTTLSKYFE